MIAGGGSQSARRARSIWPCLEVNDVAERSAIGGGSHVCLDVRGIQCVRLERLQLIAVQSLHNIHRLPRIRPARVPIAAQRNIRIHHSHSIKESLHSLVARLFPLSLLLSFPSLPFRHHNFISSRALIFTLSI